MINYGDIWP